ncbi:cupin domain-containing protein [Opitutus sp. ER46]|uniref:cupin domain-containing protein n=1 Tax=Opitutus sp. ER46 TaxID=2161864 RepID=UPI000D30F95D|nr:cupin domain-containing protein [Opitutus sp. ER46]PTY00069.1 cupin domain-containing protein [Opitutus sp. ER46]
MKTSALLSNQEPGSLALAEAAPVVGHGIVSRTLLATPELRSVVFTFAPEQALTEHTSTSRALIQILSGECEFSVAGTPRMMKAGDLLHLPPNVPHAVLAKTALTMLLVLAPERKPA